MLNKTLIFLGGLVLSVAALAQASLGTVSNTQGLVTMSDGTTFTTATPGAPIVDGTRFLTSTGASVTLQLLSGCTLTLQPNQVVTVLQSMSCSELTAAIMPVTPPAGGFFTAQNLAALGMGVGIVSLQNANISGQ